MEQTENKQPKTYTEEEFNNSINGIKKRYETKIEKDYVSIDKYNELETKLKYLQEEVKKPEIEKTFIKCGGKQEAFGDFLKLNSELVSIDTKELEKFIKDKENQYSYMFNKKEVINPANLFGDAKISEEQQATINKMGFLETRKK